MRSSLFPFFGSFGLPGDMLERIVFLVCHHHTYDGVDGLDRQILLEADYLVNARESGYGLEAIRAFRENIARTAAGKRLIDNIYLR